MSDSKFRICEDPDPMVLPDEPDESMREAASYLRCVSTHGREVRDSEGNLLGYWQTPEYLQGCLDVADELDRVAGRLKSP